MSTGVLVVVDDDPRQRATLTRALASRGHRVIAASGPDEAVAHAREQSVDIVLTDLRMPEGGGQAVVERVRHAHPEVAIVVVTAFGTVTAAVEAMKAGAADFLLKPIDLDALDRVVARLLERRDLVRENRALRRRLEVHGEFGMLGHAPALLEVLARAGRAAETEATVLVRGESGTGKELLARSLHALSRRAEGPFVALNCAALPETLLESELFGYEKGAFTGAVRRHAGRLEQANGGTLFLDEIGDVPASVQVKLLRVLQEREFTRLGGGETVRADLRVIAATHRDLERMVAEERFREDLFYRLQVVTLTLPPLRHRREDVPRLIEHFSDRFSKRYDRPLRSFTREAMDALLRHDWPGNVRELENAIEQAVVLAPGENITRADLPAGLRGPSSEAPTADPFSPEAVRGNLAERLDQLEHRIVLETLALHDGNQSRAARHLGLTESGLRYKLQKWAAAPTT